MNKFFAVAIAALGMGSVMAQTEFAWFSPTSGAFSFQAPKTWKKSEKEQFLSVSSPDGQIALTASAYAKPTGDLREFANYRFESIESFYKMQGSEQKLVGGVFREYEGTWPGEKFPTYYVISARRVAGGFVSLTVVTDRADFKKNQAMYLQIMQSAKIGP